MQNVVILSDGCRPTEDIYLMESAATHLKLRHKIRFKVIDCKKQRPNNHFLKSINQIFVAFRTLPEDWIQYLENTQEKRLIYVLDDDLRAAAITPELPEKYRTRISSFAHNYLVRLLDLADTLVVTSTHLMNAYSAYNPVRLNPTALKLPESTTDFYKGKLSIAYHATSSHKADLEHIQEPLISVLDSYKCSFESLIGEHTPKKIREHRSVQLRNPKSYSGFRRFQARAKRNICVAPLLDTPYNNGKSWIKFMDAAAVGAVGIYSNRSPYTEIVQHGINGMLANDDPSDWESCLSYLLKNPEKAKIMAENALKTARSIGSFKWSYRFWLKRLSSQL